SFTPQVSLQHDLDLWLRSPSPRFVALSNRVVSRSFCEVQLHSTRSCVCTVELHSTGKVLVCTVEFHSTGFASARSRFVAAIRLSTFRGTIESSSIPKFLWSATPQYNTSRRVLWSCTPQRSLQQRGIVVPMRRFGV